MHVFKSLKVFDDLEPELKLLDFWWWKNYRNPVG